MDKIKQLFALRDEAVKKNNASLFSSTQLEEIEGSALEGYLALEKLKSEVLCIYPKSTQEASKKYATSPCLSHLFSSKHGQRLEDLPDYLLRRINSFLYTPQVFQY